MIHDALAFGASQLSLALFTTLAPAGAVAYAIGAAFCLFFPGSKAAQDRLDHCLVIPLALAIIGLVASTAHLGKPSNSLFVLSGVGRSPLSNEVFAAVLFIGVAWIRWLVGYSTRDLGLLGRILLLVGCIAAIWDLSATANAYSIRTIATWDMQYTQANQIAAACCSGVVLILLVFRAAQTHPSPRLKKALFLVSGASALVLVAGEVLQYVALQGVHGSLGWAVDQVPFQPAVIAVSAVLVAVGLALAHRGAAGGGIAPASRMVVAVPLVLLGVFVYRFGFYALYMTVGL